MLARELHVEDPALTDDFRWLEVLGSEDVEWFLAELDEAFTTLPPSFSFGDGERLFRHIDGDLMERIATVGGLIDVIQRRVTSIESEAR